MIDGPFTLLIPQRPYETYVQRVTYAEQVLKERGATWVYEPGWNCIQVIVCR